MMWYCINSRHLSALSAGRSSGVGDIRGTRGSGELRLEWGFFGLGLLFCLGVCLVNTSFDRQKRESGLCLDIAFVE